VETDAKLRFHPQHDAQEIDRVELQSLTNLDVIGQVRRPLPRFLLEHIQKRLAKLLAIHAWLLRRIESTDRGGKSSKTPAPSKRRISRVLKPIAAAAGRAESRAQRRPGPRGESARPSF